MSSGFRGTSRQAHFRIVCLGGSATYGRPFFDHTSFAGWLRAFLPKADPSRKWEVINAGAISYASYRVKGLMAELARFEPDLFIVYMGHNEFLERRTMPRAFSKHLSLLRNAAGLASGLRIATVIQSGLELVGILSSVGRHIRPDSMSKLCEFRSIPWARKPIRATRASRAEVLSHYENQSQCHGGSRCRDQGPSRYL